MTARQIGIVVTENVSLVSVLLVYEPFRAANRLSGKRLVDVSFLSADGADVIAANGFPVPVNAPLSSTVKLDVLVVAASYELPAPQRKLLLKNIKRLAHQGTAIWAIDRGSLLLAEGGIPGNRRLTAHWECLPSLVEQWPALNVTQQLYVAEKGLVTSGGHTASMDMTLAYLLTEFGEDVTRVVTEELLWPGIRPPESAQRIGDLAPRQPVLREAIDLMEAHVESPLSIAEIARAIGISRRHLESLCRRHYFETPRQRYMRIRLYRARELLLHSELSITDIAIACGFGSVSSFSRSFRRLFEMAPTVYRYRFRSELARPYVQIGPGPAN